MSMIINFFAVPDTLTQDVEKGHVSIIELAQHVQEIYLIDDEYSEIESKSTEQNKFHFKEPLELYYHPTFNIIEKIYERALSIKSDIPIIGRQTFTKEEAEILLNEYVAYSGGFLTFEDIQCLYGELSKLSFEELLEKNSEKGSSSKDEHYTFIKQEFDFSDEEIAEELDHAKASYDEFVTYIGELSSAKDKEKSGLFISID